VIAFAFICTLDTFDPPVGPSDPPPQANTAATVPSIQRLMLPPVSGDA
jgi:hypothetical protein